MLRLRSLASPLPGRVLRPPGIPVHVESRFRSPNVANEPRAAVTGSHKTVGRVGSICGLGVPVVSILGRDLEICEMPA